MSSVNDVTGDRLVSKRFTKEGSENFDLIFGKKKTNGGWKYVPPTEPQAKEKEDADTGTTNIRL